MHRSTIFTMLSVLFLSVSGTPLLLDQSLEKRSYAGKGTWFYVGLGACGYYNTDSDPIVALSVDMYDSGAHCGQWVSVTNTVNQRTAYGMVRDMCPGCGAESLDMSLGLFEQLGDPNAGVLDISWYFT